MDLLIKKNKILVFPKSFTEAVYDKASLEALNNILKKLYKLINSVTILYSGNIQTDRLQIPVSLRKTGLIVTYIDLSGNIINELYIGIYSDDNTFKDSNNWKDLPTIKSHMESEYIKLVLSSVTFRITENNN